MNFSLFSVLFNSIIQGMESKQGGKENTSNSNFYRILEGIGENFSIPLFNSGIPGSIIYSGDEDKEVLNKDSHNQYNQFIKVSSTDNQDYSIRLNPSELIHNLAKINNYNEENHLIKELFTNHYVFDNTDIDLNDEDGIILSIKLPDFLKNDLLEKINSIIINKDNFEKNNFLFEASDNTVGIPISIPISQSKNFKINTEKQENNAIKQVYLKFCIKDFLNLNKDITGKDNPLTVILDDFSLTDYNNVHKYAKRDDRQEYQSQSILNKIIGSDGEYAKSIFSDSKDYFGEGNLKVSDLKNFENENVPVPLQLEVEKDCNVFSFLFFSDFDNIKDEFENKKSIPIKVFLKSKEDFVKTNLDEKIFDGYVKFNGSVKDEIFSDLKAEDKKTDLPDNADKEVNIFQEKLDDKPISNENIKDVVKDEVFSDLKVGDKKIDLPDNLNEEVNIFQEKLNDKPVAHENIKDVVKDEVFSDLKVENKKIDLPDNLNKEVNIFQDKLNDKPVTNDNIDGVVKDGVFSDLKVGDKKIDLPDNVNKEVNIFQNKLDDKPVTNDNIKGNLFIDLTKIENIDSEEYELPVINPFYADKKISIIIPKDSLTILKNSNLDKVNKEKIDIPIIIREVQNYSDNDADEEAIKFGNFSNIDYNTTDKTKNDEYLTERKYYNELVKSEILQLNVLEIENIDENIKKVPFKIIRKEEENLVKIENMDNKVFNEVKIPEETNYKAYIKIDEQKGTELYILMDENSYGKDNSFEIKDVIFNPENINKNEDGSISIPIKVIPNEKIDNESNQKIIDNNSRIYITPKNIEIIKTNVKNLPEKSDVKVPVDIINSANKNEKPFKVYVETNKNVIMEIINYDSEFTSNGEKVDKIDKNYDIRSYETKDTKQIKVKLILTIREENIETDNVSVNRNESRKNLYEISKNDFIKSSEKGNIGREFIIREDNAILNDKNNEYISLNDKNNEGVFKGMSEDVKNSEIIKKEVVNNKTENNNDAKLFKNLSNTESSPNEDTMIKKVFKIPVEISAGKHYEESDNEMIKGNLIIERNVNFKSKEYGTSFKNVEIKAESTGSFDSQEIFTPERSLKSENFSFGSDLIKKDNEESDFEAIKFNKILFQKGEGFINELNRLNNKNDSDKNISFYNREIIENNIEEIVNEARMILRRGKSQIRMELEPKTLGKMEMNITMENSKLIAKIRVDSQEVKNLFTDNINKLKDSLNEEGVQIQRIDVFVRDGQNNFTRYNFSENKQGFYNHYRENKPSNYNEYEEKESNLLSIVRNMGYNTIELVA